MGRKFMPMPARKQEAIIDEAKHQAEELKKEADRSPFRSSPEGERDVSSPRREGRRGQRIAERYSGRQGSLIVRR